MLYGIRFNRIFQLKLIGFYNGDWDECVDDMRSISSYVFFLSSDVFARCLKKQHLGAQSSAEVEYIVVTQQAIW